MLAFRAGFNYGETSEDFLVSTRSAGQNEQGTYRNITGNQALAWAWWRRACRAGCRCSSAPI